MNTNDIFDEGFQVARSNSPMTDPYPQRTAERLLWDMGLLAGSSTKGPEAEYTDRPFKPWNGEMVYSETLQQFFQNPDELLDYLRDEGLDMPENLKLRICEPGRWSLLDSDYWYDEAEDFGTDIPEELEDAIEVLNNVIRSLPAAYWYPGPYRTEMPCAK